MLLPTKMHAFLNQTVSQRPSCPACYLQGRSTQLLLAKVTFIPWIRFERSLRICLHSKLIMLNGSTLKHLHFSAGAAPKLGAV